MVNEYYYKNPFAILGISCIASNIEIIKAKEKIEKLAKLGVENSYKTNYICDKFPKIDRSSGIVQAAISGIDNPVNQLFWFSDSSYLENYDSTLQMASVYSEPLQFEYDVFLLEYFDLLFNDSSFNETERWIKILKTIVFFFNSADEELEKFLYPRKNNDIKTVFTNNILLPIVDICNQIELNTTINILKIFSEAEVEKTSAFDTIRFDLTDSIINKINNRITELTSFADEKKIDFYSKAVSLAKSNISMINELSTNIIVPIMMVVDDISVEKIKDIVNNKLNECACRLIENMSFSAARQLIPLLNKYAPFSKTNEYKELERSLSDLCKYEKIVIQKNETGQLDKQERALLSSNDPQVRIIAFKAFGGDLESICTLGIIFSTPVYKRHVPISIPYDYTKGIDLLKSAANRGDKNACKHLGVKYLEDGVTGSDHYKRSEGIKYLEKASYMGDAQADQLLSTYRSSRNKAVAQGVASGCLGCSIPFFSVCIALVGVIVKIITMF